MRGAAAKRAAKERARRSGASAVVGWPVIFGITRALSLGQNRRSSRSLAEGNRAKRERNGRRGKGTPGELQAFTPKRLPKPSLLREATSSGKVRCLSSS